MPKMRPRVFVCHSDGYMEQRCWNDLCGNSEFNLMQESPRQTKQKKCQSMKGILGQKFDANRACFPKEEHRIHKNGRNS